MSTPPSVPSDDDAERFWTKVDKAGADDCWPWTASKNGDGRGQFSFGGRRHMAPRIAWSLEHGEPFPEHLMACHSCDNPSCVNPRHIWPGTMRDNAIDAVRKGRVVSPYSLGSIPHNRLKTHCANGHEYNSENTRNELNGSRACRICHRAANRRYYDKLKLRARSLIQEGE